MARKILNLEKLVFDRLTVTKLKPPIKNKHIEWICKCNCGKEIIVRQIDLIRGKTKSCGCLRKENAENLKKKHNMSNSKEFSIWASMIDRCNNKNNNGYKNYGGRGITVCDEWLEFENFYEDMGECLEGYSIERIDVDGDYCKENCCWIPRVNQSKNRRSNIYVEFDNKNLRLTDWCQYFKMNRNKFWSRWYSGWTIPQIAGEDPRNGKYYKLKKDD